jgi:hypothetical protein
VETNLCSPERMRQQTEHGVEEGMLVNTRYLIFYLWYQKWIAPCFGCSLVKAADWGPVSLIEQGGPWSTTLISAQVCDLDSPAAMQTAERQPPGHPYHHWLQSSERRRRIIQIRNWSCAQTPLLSSCHIATVPAWRNIPACSELRRLPLHPVKDKLGWN